MKRGLGFWLALIAVVLVGAAVIVGLATVGGPGAARLEKLDDARFNDLYSLEQSIHTVWRRNGAPPPSLDSLGVLPPNALTDPETGEPYDYRVLSDSTAELCATFAQASDDHTVGINEWSDLGAYSAGRHCFTLYPPRPR